MTWVYFTSNVLLCSQTFTGSLAQYICLSNTSLSWQHAHVLHVRALAGAALLMQIIHHHFQDSHSSADRFVKYENNVCKFLVQIMLKWKKIFFNNCIFFPSIWACDFMTCSCNVLSTFLGLSCSRQVAWVLVQVRQRGAGTETTQE